MAGHRVVHQRLDLAGVGDVQGGRLAPGLGRRRTGAGLVDVGQHHGGPPGGQPGGHRPADPRGGPGDDGDLAGEVAGQVVGVGAGAHCPSHSASSITIPSGPSRNTSRRSWNSSTWLRARTPSDSRRARVPGRSRTRKQT